MGRLKPITVFAGFLSGLIITLCVVALTAGRGGSAISYPSASPGVFYVVASNAPAEFRRGGPNVWLCGGTQAAGGDEVELQAAIDAADSTDGTVNVVGDLYVSKASGTEWTLKSCSMTSSTGVIDTLVFDGTFTIADVEVGQFVRLWAGNDGSANSMEDNHEELVATITAVGADNFTVSESNPVGGDYTALLCRRMMCAVNLKPGVRLSGVGTKGGTIKLANTQNCNVLHIGEGESSDTAGWYVSDITIHGNDANQNGSGTAMDRRCNGVVTSEYTQDTYFTRVNIVSCSGDACWIGRPWGSRVVGGWWEHCEGGGLYLTDQGGVHISGLKINANDGPALVIRNSNWNHINGRILGTYGEVTHADTDTYSRDEYSAKILGSNSNVIVGAEVRGYDTDQSGALYLDGSSENTINGCLFYCDGTSGKQAIQLGSASCIDNTIVGNTFDCHSDSGVAGLDDWANNCNVITNNAGAREPEDDCYCILMKNVSGGAVARRSVVVRAEDGYTTTATAGDSSVLGFTEFESTVADDAYGHVQTRGYNQYLTVGDSDGENIVAGDLLCTSDTAGWAREAASGDWVFAVAKGTRVVGAAASGTVKAILIEPYLLP